MKSEDERGETVFEPEAEVTPLEDLLEEHQTRREKLSPGSTCLMGRVLDDHHPTLGGRALIRWRTASGGVHERWLLTLQGLPVRKEDRVLMLYPEGSEEPVVTGVLDGFARRPDPGRQTAQVELRRDEAVRIVGARGEPLLEIHQGESGPVLTLLHDDIELAARGRLRIRGRQVHIEATEGRVEVDASDEVALRGELIKLN